MNFDYIRLANIYLHLAFKSKDSPRQIISKYSKVGSKLSSLSKIAILIKSRISKESEEKDRDSSLFKPVQNTEHLNPDYIISTAKFDHERLFGLALRFLK